MLADLDHLRPVADALGPADAGAPKQGSVVADGVASGRAAAEEGRPPGRSSRRPSPSRSRRGSAATLAGVAALLVALAPLGLRTVAPDVAVQARLLAGLHRPPYGAPGRDLVEALAPTWWLDPWGRPLDFTAGDRTRSAGPDGALDTPDDVAADRPWAGAPDGSFAPGAGWWTLHAAPALAGPLAAYLLLRRTGRRGPSPRRTRALAALVPLLVLVWLGGGPLLKPVLDRARELAVFPTLVPREVAALGTVGLGLWALVLALDLTLLAPRERA